MFKFAPARLWGGAVRQSAVPKTHGVAEVRRAQGLNMRGVVVRLYTRDDPPPGIPSPASTYCAVVTYPRRILLPKVQVTQPVGSLHTGQIGGLRATTMALSGILDLDHVNPSSLDGTHVVISFLDDDLSQPYVSAILEHPQADGGGPIEGEVQDRTRWIKDDGLPLLTRWNGATWGLDGAGDWRLDLENAHDGTLSDGGVEPDPSTDGSRGNIRIALPEGSKVEITIGGGESVTIEKSATHGRLVIGSGTHSVAVAEHLETLWESLRSWLYNELVVLTSFGTSGPPAAAGAPEPPSWDSAINSDKLKLPDTE